MVDEAYLPAREKLLLCEGYSDNNTLLKISDKLYYAWDNVSSMTNWRASLDGMTASCSGNTVKSNTLEYWNSTDSDGISPISMKLLLVFPLVLFAANYVINGS